MQEGKLSLIASNMVLYRENRKDTTKKLLVLMSEFSKVARYKTNIQKSVTFQNISNELF